MASSDELMMAASRFSLRCNSSLRRRSAAALSCRARRSASNGPWSMMAQMKCVSSSSELSMRAICRSPAKVPADPARKITSLDSLVPFALASVNDSATFAKWLSLTSGNRNVKGRSFSRGRNRRSAMALLSSTMPCSSTTIRASGTLEKSVRKRSDAPSAARWLYRSALFWISSSAWYLRRSSIICGRP